METLDTPAHPETPTDKMRAYLRQLSHREMYVLVRLRDGWRNWEIAEDIGVTESTVKSHVSTLFRKLDVKTRTQAAVAAQRLFCGRSL